MRGLLDFLAQWPFRKAPDELVLLGLPLFWWNRIGGIMQFIGGSFIIAEIVGFDKISKYSRSITFVFLLTFLLSVFIFVSAVAAFGPLGEFLIQWVVAFS